MTAMQKMMRWIGLCVLFVAASGLVLGQEKRGGFQPDDRFFWPPDGSRLAVMMDDGVFVFEVSSFEVSSHLKPAIVLDVQGATAGAFMGDNTVLAVAADTGLSIWRLPDSGFQPEPLFYIPTIDDLAATWITTLLFSPDGRFLAASGCPYIDGCQLFVWDVDANRVLVNEASPYIYDLDFSADGTVLGVAQRPSMQGTRGRTIDVRRIVLANPESLSEELWPAGRTEGFYFFPAGVVLDIDALTMLVTGYVQSSGLRITVVSLPSYDRTSDHSVLTDTELIAASPNGAYVAYNVPYFLMIYNVSNLETWYSIRVSFYDGIPLRIMFNGDGSRLAAITSEGALSVWDVATGGMRMFTPYGLQHIDVPGAG